MGIKKKDRGFLRSLIGHTESYDFYYDKIKELSISVFDWQNVPDGIDVRYLELMLFDRGSVIFFKDEEMDRYLCLPYADQGPFNIYRLPLVRRAFADNSYNRKLSIDNSVIIFNNVIRTPSVRDARIFARRLAKFDEVIDINVNAQKTPILIRCSEKERLSLENLYMNYDGGIPVIFGDQELSAQPLSAIMTQAPYVADKIYDLKTKFWNEMLTFKGISNLNIQKKERLITDEVQRSQGGTIASRYSGLMMRQQACDEINKMFGLDLWCEYREDPDGSNLEDGPDPEQEEGGTDE